MTMEESELRSRLSRISTRWSLLRDAHGEDGDHVLRAQTELFERYRGAAYRYLVAILRSADAADDVFQDFSLRFLRGDYHRATPEKGRFRNYLKTSLSRLAVDYHRKRRRVGVPLADPARDPESPAGETEFETAEFETCWRTGLLENAWSALAKLEAETGTLYYSTLRYYSEHPGSRSKDIAMALTESLHPERPFTADGIRQTVHRARKRFSDLLIDETATSIGSSDLDEVEEELAALKLLDYCRGTLNERRKSL